MSISNKEKAVHVSVLLDEVLKNFKEYLDQSVEGVVVDCTLGAGGHSFHILKEFPKVSVIGIDLDLDAIEIAKERLANFGNRFIPFNCNYSDISEMLSCQSNEVKKMPVLGILADLGISSIQLDSESRGFSYRTSQPLDMRMGDTALSAHDVVNEYSFSKLVRVFKVGGAPKEARALADSIVNLRPIKDTYQLAEICKNIRFRLKIKKKGFTSLVFQAIRIEVNDELSHLKKFLNDSISQLSSSGVLQVISFHSIEDKLVTSRMREWMKEDDLERMLPSLNTSIGKLVTKKAVVPTIEEIENNPRSRSAMLRVFKKI